MSQVYNELSGIYRTSSSDHQRSHSQVADDLRKLLEKKYRSDATIPTELTEALFPNRGSFSESVMSDLNDGDGNEEVERTIIAKVLNDPNIPAAEKEVIAKSILQGNFEIQRASHSSQSKSHQQQRFQAVRQVATHGKDYNSRQNILMHINRHRLPKPHFLEVITQSAEIPIVSPKKLHRERVQLLKNSISLGKLKPKANTIDRSNSPHNNEVMFSDDHFPSDPFLTASSSAGEGGDNRAHQSKNSATVFKDPNPTYRERYSKLLAEERVKRLKEAKEKVLADREHIKRQKEYEKLSIEKRVEVKKRLNEFRQKLKEFLQQKKDPMSGEIMRVMDDSLVYYLLEKYAGYSMSPEAILALLGSSIGTPILNPDPEDMPPLAKKLPELSSSVGGGLSQSESLLPESSLMKKSTMTASLSAQLSYVSLINNYRAFGQRSPSSSPNHSPSPPPSRPIDSGSASRDNIFDRTFPASMVFSHGINASSNSPVTGFPLRPIEFDLHPGSSAPFKTYAGGFRTKPATSSSHGSGQGGREESYHPLFNNPTSPYPGNFGRKSPLVVLSSEHFRSVAKEMGYAFPNLLQQEQVIEDPLGDRLAAERAEKEFEDTQEKIEDAISVMHEQLLEEGMLPALRPGAVMTRQQLEQLGEKKLTVDQLFYQLTGKDLRKVLKRAPTSRAEEIKAKLERNPTMSAKDLSMINDLLELEREQAQQDKQQSQATEENKNEVVNITVNRPSLTSQPSFPASFPTTPGAEPLQPPPLRDDASTLSGGSGSVSAGGGGRFPFVSQSSVHSLHPIPEAAKSKSTDSQDEYQQQQQQQKLEGGDDANSSESPLKSGGLKRSHTSPARIVRMNSYSGGLTPTDEKERDGSKSTPSRPLLLRGATMMIPDDAKLHLEEVAKQEGAKAVKRLVLPAARANKEKYQELLAEFPLLQQSVEKEEKEALDRIIAAGAAQKKDSTTESKEEAKASTAASDKKKDKKRGKKETASNKPTDLDSLFQRYPQFDDPIPQKGPRSLKSRELQTGGSFLQRSGTSRPTSSSSALQPPVLETHNNSSSHSQLPPNPYQSWTEETKILNSGVASGAGLMLWQSRERADALGRYRVGRSSKSPALRPLPRELHGKSSTTSGSISELGGSIGNPYNVNSLGYNGIHGDNIYAKSKYRLKPFVSAI